MNRQSHPSYFSALGHVAFDRRQLENTVPAEAILQTVDQRRDIALVRIAVERRLVGRDGLGDSGFERHHLDAKSRIDRIQLLGEETQQQFYRVARTAGADHETVHRAVDAIEAEDHAPCTQPCFCKRG